MDLQVHRAQVRHRLLGIHRAYRGRDRGGISVRIARGAERDVHPQARVLRVGNVERRARSAVESIVHDVANHADDGEPLGFGIGRGDLDALADRQRFAGPIALRHALADHGDAR